MGDDRIEEALLNDGDDVDGHLLNDAHPPGGIRLLQHLLQPLRGLLQA